MKLKLIKRFENHLKWLNQKKEERSFIFTLFITLYAIISLTAIIFIIPIILALISMKLVLAYCISVAITTIAACIHALWNA